MSEADDAPDEGKKDKRGPRGMMAIKSKHLDIEWQNLVRKAAAKEGIGIGDFIVEAARSRALQVVTDRGQEDPSESNPAGIPARPEDLVDAAAARAAEMATTALAEALLVQQAERLAEIRQELQRATRRGRWRGR